ncbi:hypothetical protein [Pseudoxanthomonas sp. UTMC 1351]|uniref:hypothetical protein n=1 Tax=Pseudoxanthomonas sp. UTMC 1351 TaxID=2695853 RepID=UPI0034CD71B0
MDLTGARAPAHLTATNLGDLQSERSRDLWLDHVENQRRASCLNNIAGLAATGARDRADDAAGATNRTPISGATAQTYTVVAADRNKHLVFEVTPVVAEGTPDTGTPVSAAVPGTAPTVKAGSMSITGVYEVGQTLTGQYEYEDADGDAEDVVGAQFTWHIGHPVSGAPTLIEGATSRTYVLRAEDQGSNRKLWFTVVKVKSLTGMPNERVGSWQATRQEPLLGTAPTITGTLTTGSVLTGNVGYADADGDAAGTHLYQWYRADNAAGTTNKVVIAGATAVPSYTGRAR